MVFVSLGTLDVPFPRLLDAVEKQIKNGTIVEPVLVQAGKTSFQSDCMEIVDLMSMRDFQDNIEKASLVICHAGYGVLSSALEAEKKLSPQRGVLNMVNM